MEISPTIFIVPTGIGCDIGGFAGDALPTAKLLASASGCLITHPNVMNGGALSEKNTNIFYVEGYSLDRFARGEIGLRRVKQHEFKLSEAKEIQDATCEDLVTIEEAFKNIDSIRISKDNTKKFINGVKFKHEKTQIDYIKVYSEDNKFLGLGEVNKNYLKHKQLV